MAYREALARQWRIVAIVAATAVGIALLWIIVSGATYKATASLLAAPLPTTNESFVGIDLLRESADGTRTMQTAAAVLDTRAAAQRTAEKLGGSLTTRDVQDNVAVEPQGQTNIIDVTASADTAAGAALLANTFVESALDLRSARLGRQAAEAVADVRARLKALPSGSSAAGELEARLPQLEAVRAGTDPTLGVGQAATPPDDASGTPPILILLLAGVLGLLAGAGMAIWIDGSRRRGATADELVAAHSVPLLAHVTATRSVSSERLPAARTEAYRSVFAQLHHRDRRTILVTSAAEDDGKSAAVAGLGLIAAASGLRVVIVDLDPRWSGLASLLDVPASAAVEPDLLERPGATLAALASVPNAPGLSLLLVSAEPATTLRVESTLRNMGSAIPELGRAYDLVLLNTPPLGAVSDALRVLDHAHDVIVVARPGSTELRDLRRAYELLERAGHHADGLLLFDPPPTPPHGRARTRAGASRRPAREPAAQ